MKIKTQAEADALNAKILSEMGVDISAYRDQEVIDKLAELIVFPMYALESVLRPIGLFLLFWIAGFWLWDLVHLEYLLYVIPGFVLFAVAGFFAGILYLSIRFRNDINSMLNYSMEILRNIVADVDKVNKGTNKANLQENLTLLFAGVLHIVTIPAAASIVAKKIPFIGGYVSGLLTRILRRIANIFKWPEMNRMDAKYAAGSEGKILPMYLESVTALERTTGQILKVAMRVVQAPVLLFFAVFGGLAAILVWLLN
ncbi:hypothetical protein [Lewinella sp. 4G2]|uniref:hypothetical protein n=1 Tax=Lewinella sp. 4G2 TaxID=1803372 RepID=UPI0007B4CFDF|nr:hypothetical protein [Lewinella sp. 4G2]OAV42834.1 hypothetical protein A3850_016520 [Lewinella sp. 4G2]